MNIIELKDECPENLAQITKDQFNLEKAKKRDWRRFMVGGICCYICGVLMCVTGFIWGQYITVTSGFICLACGIADTYLWATKDCAEWLEIYNVYNLKFNDDKIVFEYETNLSDFNDEFYKTEISARKVMYDLDDSQEHYVERFLYKHKPDIQILHLKESERGNYAW